MVSHHLIRCITIRTSVLVPTRSHSALFYLEYANYKVNSIEKKERDEKWH